MTSIVKIAVTGVVQGGNVSDIVITLLEASRDVEARQVFRKMVQNRPVYTRPAEALHWRPSRRADTPEEKSYRRALTRTGRYFSPRDEENVVYEETVRIPLTKRLKKLSEIGIVFVQGSSFVVRSVRGQAASAGMLVGDQVQQVKGTEDAAYFDTAQAGHYRRGMGGFNTKLKALNLTDVVFLEITRNLGPEFPTDSAQLLSDPGVMHDYHQSRYARPLFDGMLQVMTGKHQRHATWGSQEEWTGDYRPDRKKTTKKARVHLDLDVPHTPAEPGQEYGGLSIKMSFGGQKKRHERNTNKAFVSDGSTTVEIKGPMYKMWTVRGGGWQSRQPIGNLPVGMWTRHRFRTGKEVMDLMYAELVAASTEKGEHKHG